MYITTSLVAAALLLHPLGVFSQATPQQTIVPFSSLPACAAKCGPLFDAQGACSPPTVATSSVSCFCQYGTLQSFYTTASGVCPGACPQDPTGLGKIQAWFLGLCPKPGTQPTTTGSSPTTTGTSASTAAPANGDGSGSTPTNGSKKPWISTHWQWIVMVVVILLAIIIGWIAACLLRRRYIRRKEREFELRPPPTPWVAGSGTHPGPGGAPAPSPYAENTGSLGKGKNRESAMFVSRPPSAALGALNEKSEGGYRKKKWVVKERT